MKKAILIFAMGLFEISLLQAQNVQETLTNNSIIKMTKATLGDDLIIDVINTSSVNFTMSEDSINALVAEQVSAPVMAAMKLKTKPQSAIVTEPSKVSDTKLAIEHTVIDSVRTVQNSTIKIDTLLPNNQVINATPVTSQPVINAVVEIPIPVTKVAPIQKKQVNAVAYVAPMNELIAFFNDEFKTFNISASDWDKQVRDSLQKADELNKRMAELEKKLCDLKNADAKGYSTDILALKKTLNDYRMRDKQLKLNFLNGGLALTKKLKTISTEKEKSISNKFSEVSSQVKSTNFKDSKNASPVQISFTKEKTNDNIVNFVAPVTELLAWYQNENDVLMGVIEEWNNKAIESIHQEAIIAMQSDSLKNILESYKSDTKKYKTEISQLKKQISATDKKRKQVESSINNDGKQLSTVIKQIKTETQNTVIERFLDIIENMNYLYQEKLNI